MSQTSPGSSGNRPRRDHRRRNGLVTLLVILILLLILLLFFFPRPAATVVLTPVNKSLSNNSHFLVPLHALTANQHDSQTGDATGPTKPGTHSHGALIFKNVTFSPVTIVKGTVITNNAGQQVTTDDTIVIPPDPPAIPGIASVHATAVKVGKVGNIQAMSINRSCCFTGITVLNPGNFSGGLDDQTTHTIQQSDIDRIAEPLETTLTQTGQHAVQVQLKRGERLVTTPAQCPNPLVSSNPAVGTSADHFTVTVVVHCTDEAYNPETALSQAQSNLLELARQQLGPNYTLSGDITTTIEQIMPPQNGTVDIQVVAKGTWKFLFTMSRLQTLARLIAGLNRADAQKLLSLQPEVLRVSSISFTGPILDLHGHDHLPYDPSVISIIA